MKMFQDHNDNAEEITRRRNAGISTSVVNLDEKGVIYELE